MMKKINNCYFVEEGDKLYKPNFMAVAMETPEGDTPLTSKECKQIGEGVLLNGRSYKKVNVIYTN